MSLQESLLKDGDLLVELRDLRHRIHQHPELGFTEFETHNQIVNTLKKHGFSEFKTSATTGIIIDLKGEGKPNPSLPASFIIALRADIDCLPMQEENNLPYKSQIPNQAHMCGHDGHTTLLVGAAILLKKVSAQLPSNVIVRFLFQPAEEGPGGAPVMIKEGALDGVNEIYGLHNFPPVPVGKVSVIKGPTMAHVTTFYVTVHGKGGHASQPQVAIDPIVTAAHIIVALQTVVSRSLHPRESAVVSVCQIHSGTTHNVIPNTCTFTGTIRDFDPKAYDTITAKISQIVTNTAAALGAQGEVVFEPLYPVLVNTEKETDNMVRVIKRACGDDSVSSDHLPMMAAEDFAYFTEKVPGCFFFLGGGEEGRNNAMLHSTTFDFNDNSLPVGIKIWIRLVEDRAGVSLYS